MACSFVTEEPTLILIVTGKFSLIVSHLQH